MLEDTMSDKYLSNRKQWSKICKLTFSVKLRNCQIMVLSIVVDMLQ